MQVEEHNTIGFHTHAHLYCQIYSHNSTQKVKKKCKSNDSNANFGSIHMTRAREGKNVSGEKKES